MSTMTLQQHPEYPYEKDEYPCTDCGVYATTGGSLGETNCPLCFNVVEWAVESDFEENPAFEEMTNNLRQLLLIVGTLPTRGAWAIVRAHRASSCKKHYWYPRLSIGDSKGCEDCDKWYAEQCKIVQEWMHREEDEWDECDECDECDEHDDEPDFPQSEYVRTQPPCAGHYYDTNCPACNTE